MPEATVARERSTREKKKWVNKTWVQILVPIGGLVIYVLIGFGLWWLLDQYIAPTQSSHKKDLIQALSLIMAGLGGGIGLYFTWQNTKLTRENTRATLQQAKESTEAQLEHARQGQITDRFTRAIDQLGATNDDKSKRLEIRLGGIYSLEQTAKHSPEHYSAIIGVLTAYVRENAQWSPDKASGPTLKWHQVAANPEEPSIIASGVSNDIQTILDVLGRRQEEHIPEDYLTSISLHQANLPGANLIGADLSGADLARANLSRALLVGADLSGADLSEADLSGAYLSGANLSKAILRETHLEGAKLQAQSLRGLERQRVALLRDRGVINVEVEVLGSRLVYGADLESAYFLTQEQIEWAIGDSSTKLPEYCSRPEAWGSLTSRSDIEQTKSIVQRLKQEYGTGNETTDNQASSHHNGAERTDQVDKDKD